MNTLIYIKKQFSKLFAILMIAGFVASCATVTDANLEDAGTFESEAVEESSADKSTDNIWLNGNGDDMSPIVDEPPSGSE